jgi:hypothetical protein
MKLTSKLLNSNNAELKMMTLKQLAALTKPQDDEHSETAMD